MASFANTSTASARRPTPPAIACARPRPGSRTISAGRSQRAHGQLRFRATRAWRTAWFHALKKSAWAENSEPDASVRPVRLGSR